jgi:hypothetical protein
VVSNISSNATAVNESLPVVSNFSQFLNSSFLDLFNVSSTVASAASTSSSGGLFSPEKIALLDQESSTLAEPTGKGDLALMLMKSASIATAPNASRFSVIG